MSQAVITLIILAVAIVLFVSDKLPMGLVAFMVPVALYFTGIIEADDIFTCVINSNVILILGMCVFGADVSFGGTSIIIIVGVVIETLKQIESQMRVRYYKGFLND